MPRKRPRRVIDIGEGVEEARCSDHQVISVSGEASTGRGVRRDNLDGARRGWNEYEEFQKSLPIFTARRAILDHIRKHPVVILIGETGSGKTTQLPQYIYESLDVKIDAKIAITQPRRLAAKSVAQRVSSEMKCSLGDLVGYHVRFERKSGPKTIINFLTDGMLLREFMLDSELKEYRYLILDEAHERTLNTEIACALIRQLQARRPDLKLIIMSATLDDSVFKSYFDNPPILYVQGRMFSVQIYYTAAPLSNLYDGLIRTILQIHLEEPSTEDADILAFLCGFEEIQFAARSLKEKSKELPPESPKLLICTLYSAQSLEKQQIVFSKTPANCRKIVLATNIAESSITVPAIKYVVDTGLVKQKHLVDTSHFEQQVKDGNVSGNSENNVITSKNNNSNSKVITSENNSNNNSKVITNENNVITSKNNNSNSKVIMNENNSNNNSNNSNSKVITNENTTNNNSNNSTNNNNSISNDNYNLITNNNHTINKTPLHSNYLNLLKVVPESRAQSWQRAGRAGRTQPGKVFRLFTESYFLNEMQAVHLPEIKRVDLTSLVLMLFDIGIKDPLNFPYMEPLNKKLLAYAITNLMRIGAVDRTKKITQLGKKMTIFPLDPRYSAALIRSKKFDCTNEMLSLLAMLTCENVFHLEEHDTGFNLHTELWGDEETKYSGDHAFLLKLYYYYSNEPVQKRKSWAKAHSVNWKSMERAISIRNQLLEYWRTTRWPLAEDQCIAINGTNDDWKLISQKIGKCLLAGFIDNVALATCKGTYESLRNATRLYIHPSSTMFNSKAQCVLCDQIVYTTKCYMRTVMPIERIWVEEARPVSVFSDDSTR